MNFFSFNFPLREFFFCTLPTAPPPPPTSKFSNGPSLIVISHYTINIPKIFQLFTVFWIWQKRCCCLHRKTVIREEDNKKGWRTGKSWRYFIRALVNPYEIQHSPRQRNHNQIRIWCCRSFTAQLGRLRFTFTPNGRREFVSRDLVFPLFSVYSLLLLHKNKSFYASFNHRNISGLFLSAYFLFWEILNLSLTFAVCSKRES